MASIFTKIINQEIPSYKVFEDDLTYAFLDINPVQLGHTLIVPKVEVDYFLDVEDPYYSQVFKNAKTIGKAIHEATGKRVGTIIAGWDVPHFHYHLIPMSGIGDLDLRNGKKRTEEEMKDIHEKITNILKGK